MCCETHGCRQEGRPGRKLTKANIRAFSANLSKSGRSHLQGHTFAVNETNARKVRKIEALIVGVSSSIRAHARAREEPEET